ncbi:DUF624 domain-containing protein [Sediminibacillus dalangtanensis]|uniref:DUF624 domain-containing protein n=1 Tax=Sediminibacillus dalangtanensis TaxID=2729421 RepID=A0ABX7VV98_9BACI|nr:DUF624 domain-containing protein [Sediminibacillus dalangtanensis]QTN00464.1 DUF624 domain-containing protein [Sediminibacillus dalangtanensis]
MNPGGALYTTLEWITRFAYINLLWILFTLTGGVLFGFFPATIAMFALVRQWLLGKSSLPVMGTFWSYYKKDFWKSNLLGLFVSIIVLLIYIDIQYIQLTELEWTYVPLFAFMLLFVFYLFYLFPVFVHFDLKVSGMLRNAFLIMLVNPISTFFMVVCLVCTFVVMRYLPALFFIFGGSVYAFITMWMSMHAFRKIAAKSQ